MKVRRIIEEEWDYLVDKIGESGLCKGFWDQHGYLKVSIILKDTIELPNFLHLVMIGKNSRVLGVFHGEIVNGTLTSLAMVILESNYLKRAELKVIFCKKIEKFAVECNLLSDDLDHIHKVKVDT